MSNPQTYRIPEQIHSSPNLSLLQSKEPTTASSSDVVSKPRHNQQKQEKQQKGQQKQYEQPIGITSQQLLKKASKELTKSLSENLPFLMYGSGDVYPYAEITSTNSKTSNERTITTNNDPNAISLLAEYTCEFIHDLVHAAIDSHDIYTNGNGGGIIPVPKVVTPSVHYSDDNHSDTSGYDHNTRKRQVRDWEEELPMPIITSLKKSGRQRQPQPLWQGSIGLNITSNEIRSTYMSSTQTINEKSFLLPIYHDEIMYNRCKEILSFHKEITNVLFDPGVRQFVSEGLMDRFTDEVDDGGVMVSGKTGSKSVVKGMSNEEKRKRQRTESNISSSRRNDAITENDDFDIVNWPGFDSLLPTYKK